MTETCKTKEGQTIARQNGSVEWTASLPEKKEDTP